MKYNGLLVDLFGVNNSPLSLINKTILLLSLNACLLVLYCIFFIFFVEKNSNFNINYCLFYKVSFNLFWISVHFERKYLIIPET